MLPFADSRLLFPTRLTTFASSWVLALFFATVLPADEHTGLPADEQTGARIYSRLCASCHGDDGQGSEEFSDPLVGSLPLDELAVFIDESMPEESPEECVGDDARRVAEFVYDAFYTSAAQAKREAAAARVELSRLTVRQYRNAVADLLATFRSAPGEDTRSGVSGAYFKSRRARGAPDAERIDAQIRFNFGEQAPIQEGFDPHEFAIRWDGSLIAPETGMYQLLLRTDQSARVWLNDTLRSWRDTDRRSFRSNVEVPLIDAFVNSGSDNEYMASVYLLGGRAYPLRIDFSKAKQGVDDSDENPPEARPASIELLWKLPKRTLEHVPHRNFLVGSSPEVCVVSTEFPADDRSVGYERGTAVSKAWDEATTEAAIEVASYVVDKLPALARLGGKAAEEVQQARVVEFCSQFVERAFRRPLTESERDFFVRRQLEGAPDRSTGVKRVVLLALKSPRFLYLDVAEPNEEAPSEENEHYLVASRLSFGLWDSLPDDNLLAAAADGTLADEAGVHSQAARMVNDRRSRAKLRAFLMQWLKVEDIPTLVKNQAEYPGFDEEAASDLRTSLELLLDEVLWSEKADFRQLLLNQSLHLNGRLAQLYGVAMPEDAPFRRVTLEKGDRAGVLTHPYLMANFAYTSESSPIHRGVFLARNVLGRALRPPADAFSPLPADLHPELTTRERVALQTQPKACLNCHGLINPLGFTLENFDAIGRYRDKENGRVIDATGGYQTDGGEAVSFGGVRDLAHFLAHDSQEAQRAFVTSLFHYFVKQPVTAFGPRVLDDLMSSFAASEFNTRELLVEIAAVAAARPAK